MHHCVAVLFDSVDVEQGLRLLMGLGARAAGQLLPAVFSLQGIASLCWLTAQKDGHST
jgi:hypothetical protein